MALTKHGIVEQIQTELGFPGNVSINFTEPFIKRIKAPFESGGAVLACGFGKLCLKDKEVRKDQNPATGKDLMLNPRRGLTFNCSGRLRDKVNGVW